MTAEISGPFDLIVATSVFEMGSGGSASVAPLAENHSV